MSIPFILQSGLNEENVVFLNPGAGAGPGSRQADQDRPSVPEWLFPRLASTKSPGKEERAGGKAQALDSYLELPSTPGPPGEEQL